MLKKLCRCGTIINYNEKYCDKCKEKYKELNKENNKIYDTKHRKNKDVYHSINWDKVRETVKIRDKGMCRCCLKLNKIEPMYLVHHIIPIEDNKSKAYDTNNLISLCDMCHRLVHKTYNASENDKVKMQEYLKELTIEEVELK